VHPVAEAVKPRRGTVLLALCTAQLLILLDTSIVHIALPSVRTDLGASAHVLQWVVTAYALAFGGFLPAAGRLGDLFGKRRMLIAGMALIAAASLAGGLAPGIAVLIAARAVQGLGAAFTAPAVLSLVADSHPAGEERNRALAVLGAVSSSGFIAGLVLGGVLTGGFGWRSVFFVNIPVAAAVILLSLLSVRESPRLRQPVDLPGAVTATAGLTLVLYACSKAETHGLSSVMTWGWLLPALLLLTAFFFIERRTRHPLIPPGSLGNRKLAGALAAAAVFGSVMGPMLFMMTLHMQHVLGFGPLGTGAAFLPQEFVLITASLFIGRLVSRIGAKAVLALGMAGFAAGMLALSGLSPEGGYWHILPGLVFIGFGIASVIVAGAVAATAGAARDDRGLASGLWNAAPHIGTAVGLAVLVPVADAFSGHTLGRRAT